MNKDTQLTQMQQFCISPTYENYVVLPEIHKRTLNKVIYNQRLKGKLNEI